MSKRRVANTGDPAKDWLDEGPSAPIPCGPTGERHTNDSREKRGTDAPIYGTTFAVKGRRPMQFPPNVAIETLYND